MTAVPRGRVRTNLTYLPIAEHGLIGDLHTVALVGSEGTIDWYCCPTFDSPSVFGAILDAERGGRFSLRPATNDLTTKQLYLPDTNVLITRFLTAGGVGEVQDFMPVGEVRWGEHRQRLIRRVVAVRGKVRFELECAPRFDYGRERHQTTRHPHGVLFEASSCRLALETEVPIELLAGDAHASFELSAGESAAFILERVVGPYEVRGQSAEEIRELGERTMSYWRRWLSQSRYQGRWREMVDRSALTLKLLTYQPNGAVVAAPTTSLPEVLGGERNWDYRYSWVRDSAFSIYALLRLGFTEEAASFMEMLTSRVHRKRAARSEPLQVLYVIDRGVLTEQVLDHLEGYRGSKPVRIGNSAADQLQLDIYGELVDSIYLYNKYGNPISHDMWEGLSGIVEWVCENWDQADDGIWETRGGRKDFSYSRLMCWVALERALRVATQRGLPADRGRWGHRARCNLPTGQCQGLERGPRRVRPALRRRRARCLAAADAAGEVRLANRPPLALHPRRDRQRARLRLAGLSLQRGSFARWPARRRGHVLTLHLLVCGGACPGRPPRRGAPGV